MVAAVRRFRTYVPSQYLWPLVLLIGVSFGGIFFLLYFSARTQDAIQLEREQQALNSALVTATAMVRHDLQDYAKWDDAVRHVTLRLDADWIDDNIVAYLGRSQGYSEIFVLDGRDRTVYSFSDAHTGVGGAQHTLGPDLAQSIAAVRRMPIEGMPIVSGFARAEGRTLLYSVAAVVPLTEKIRLQPGATNLIVIARVLDQPLLMRLTRDTSIHDLQLTEAAPSEGRQAIAVIGAMKERLAWLSWIPHRPGSLLRRQLVPAVAGLLLVGLAAAGLILRRGAKSVHALQRSELRALHLSDHDALTGLPNRRALVAAIGQRLEEGEGTTLLFMDLDGFKIANDVYGHATGDELLRQAADRIRGSAGDAFVARAGGDEFAVLCAAQGREGVERICSGILEAFGAPFSIGDFQVKLGVSIGFVDEPTAGDRLSELMRRADTAMYAAKAAGKNCARAYSPSLDDGHLLRIRLENGLRDAITQGRILVHYQPVVDALTGAIAAVEALARWSDPVHGDISPEVFIPIAETSGLINPLGRQVLLTACRDMRDKGVDLAVNLSPAQFWDGQLLGDIRAVLQETGFPPERLELEITESLMLRQPEVAAQVIDQLRTLGIRVALDDFGTGFASIGYLQQLRLDRLKIDKAFIAPIEHDAKSRDMLASITGLARACDLEVCAEGVETAAQAEIARLAGCTRLQGWHFGKPVAIGALSLGRCTDGKGLRAVS